MKILLKFIYCLGGIIMLSCINGCGDGGEIHETGGEIAEMPQWVMAELTFSGGTNFGENSQTIMDEGFESGIVSDGWAPFSGGELRISPDISRSGKNALLYANREYPWSSPSFDLYPLIKKSGPGSYTIHFYVYTETNADPGHGNLLIRGGSAVDINSFITEVGGNYFCYIGTGFATNAGEWVKYEGKLNVTKADLQTGEKWLLCLDVLGTAPGMKLYVDDFCVVREDDETSPLDFDFEAEFTSENGTKLTVPGFWDGENVWKIRFAPTEPGKWTYATKFADTSDAGLHNVQGEVNCVEYQGELEIYRRGFVKAEPGSRYFTYADGTPFFYLGDTHWSMPSEPFDTMFVSIVDDRAAKGFTVYQSEPLGAKYNLAGGLGGQALEGFRDLDKRFQYIADAGLVHANAQLFFASELGWNREAYSDEYIAKLARCWVARYGAYPVMWTTAQECDKDFYYGRDNPWFDAETNPWKIVFDAIYRYDPYSHPQTAHQENTSSTRVKNSSFKDLPGHGWFGAQWSPQLNGQLDFNVPKEYWESGKTTVNYEGRYENLWTKEFGARVQGWTAYLNGMFGYGYGAVDIWLYNSAYDVDTTSNDGIDTITPGDKAIKWEESMNFAASVQMGHMKSFFEALEWWKLEPRFDGRDFFAPERPVFYSLATIGNDVIAIYFYNKKNTNTGTLNGLAGRDYVSVWFDPVSGAYGPEVTITPSEGSHAIGPKPDNGDWVFLIMIK
jgi:hypothetical protein